MIKILNVKAVPLLLAVVLLSSFACKEASKAEPEHAAVKKKVKKVLFIGIDGLVWKH